MNSFYLIFYAIFIPDCSSTQFYSERFIIHHNHKECTQRRCQLHQELLIKTPLPISIFHLGARPAFLRMIRKVHRKLLGVEMTRRDQHRRVVVKRALTQRRQALQRGQSRGRPRMPCCPLLLAVLERQRGKRITLRMRTILLHVHTSMCRLIQLRGLARSQTPSGPEFLRSISSSLKSTLPTMVWRFLFGTRILSSSGGRRR
jgi:hypothetical protein